MAQLKYRPDIDGLRAVAVVPVVMFHLGMSWMPGGFVGVDVFFVISGYLITTIIAREIGAGTFSLFDFYERRIRRIFPALFFVLAVTLAGASMLFVPQDLYNAAQSAAAATLFAANILFFLEAGYFDVASYQKPLLHTWSLGIEEQFYIFLPLLLLLLARWRGRMVIWIGALTLMSLALSVLTTSAAPTAAYYLLPWRAWELGIGALLALNAAPVLRGGLLREIAALAGLVLILGAALLVTKETAFPGAAALAPTVGAALVIHAGREGTSLVGRFLSNSVPVWIGRLSYSLYLWHWPIIVAFVYYRMSMPSGVEAAGLFALALTASWLSWRFVEQPFRRPGSAAVRSRVFGAAATAMVAMLLVNGALVATKGLPGRLPDEARRIAAFSTDYADRTNECFWRKNSEESWLEPCLYGAGDAPATVALWGDSHGPAQVPSLDLAARDRNLSVALFARDGCPPIDGFQVYWVGQSHDCAAYLDATFKKVVNDPEIDLVVLVMRAPIYTHGWLSYGLVERDRTPLLIGDRSAPLPPGADRARFFLDGVESTVVALKSAGKQVALVYPLPEAGFAVPDGLVRLKMRGVEQTPLVPRQVFDARTADVIAGYDRLVDVYDIIPIRLHEAFCDKVACQLVKDGDPVFRDANHLNAATARRLATYFETALASVTREERVER